MRWVPVVVNRQHLVFVAAEFLAAAAAAASAANTSEPEPESFGKTRVTEQLNSKNQRLKCELRDCAVCVHEKQVTLYLSMSLCLHVCLTVRLIATYSCMERSNEARLRLCSMSRWAQSPASPSLPRLAQVRASVCLFAYLFGEHCSCTACSLPDHCLGSGAKTCTHLPDPLVDTLPTTRDLAEVVVAAQSHGPSHNIRRWCATCSFSTTAGPGSMATHQATCPIPSSIELRPLVTATVRG